VLLADVYSSGTGAPPSGGVADWSMGGEPPGDVTVWVGESEVVSETKEGSGEANYGAFSRRDAAFPPPSPRVQPNGENGPDSKE
jgi:hypothetical protein